MAIATFSTRSLDNYRLHGISKVLFKFNGKGMRTCSFYLKTTLLMTATVIRLISGHVLL